MCQFEQGFMLCSCVTPKPVVHNKRSRRHKHKHTEGLQPRYMWTLKRYLRYEDNGMIGLCFMPETNIGDGLTDEWVLLHLNASNCFDFEYAPSENDSLRICHEEDSLTFLSYIYLKGAWRRGVISPFTSIEETIQSGMVKKVTP